MCRVEERVYIRADGHRSKFEDAYPCDKARNGRLCTKVKRRTTEYYPNKSTVARNDTPSPINPPTPTGSGTYIVQQRRPSSSGSRPSTRDGQKAIKPEIVIEFGSKNGSGKKYPSISLSTKATKRTSIGSGYIDEAAIESSGSDASHTIRTGFPETPLSPHAAPTGISHGYHHHHRHTSSTSSYTGSSRTPSLYITSDPDHDSPTTARNVKLPPAIHHASTTGSSSPSKSRGQASTTSSTYNTTLVTPHDYIEDPPVQEGLYPHDYQDFADRSASSHASSALSSKSRRREEHAPSRTKRDEARRKQEDPEREATKAQEENVKQVRFELGHPEGRAKERTETPLAEKEKQRPIGREEIRRRKELDREEETSKDRQKERSKSSTSVSLTTKPASNSANTKRPTTTRRPSKTMTQSQAEEQRRLLAAELGQMQDENRAAAAREREERSAILRQQQQDPNYYNPRTGGMPTTSSALTRRDSVARRGSISSESRPTTLGRSNSNRRTSIVQPEQPSGSNQVAQTFATRPSARTHAPPPVSFPSNFNTRPLPARRSSLSSHENPFAAPPTRNPGPNMDNLFAPNPSVVSPSAMVHQDPWDARSMHDALPAARQITDSRYGAPNRGEDLRSGGGSYHAAREATRAMGRVAGFEDDYETDSDDQVTHGHGRKRHY